MQLSWHMTPCPLLNSYWRIVWACCLHLHGLASSGCEYGDSKLLQNISNYLQFYTASHPTRLDFSEYNYPLERTKRVCTQPSALFETSWMSARYDCFIIKDNVLVTTCRISLLCWIHSCRRSFYPPSNCQFYNERAPSQHELQADKMAQFTIV